MKTIMIIRKHILKAILIFTIAFNLPFITEAQQAQDSGYNKEVQKLEPRLRDVFVLRDTNGDGLINGKEYEAWGGGVQFYDLNNDGVIYPGEYASYFAKRKSTSEGQKESKSNLAISNKVKPKLGKYTCFGYGLNASGGTSGSYVYKGVFMLEAGGRYKANNTVGTFSIGQKDNKSTIRFTAGAYADLTGEVKEDKKSYEITLNFPGTKKGFLSSTQYCTCEK